MRSSLDKVGSTQTEASMTKASFKIRTSTLEDLPELFDLERRALTELNDGDYPEDIIEQFLEELDTITPELIEEGRYYVFQDDAGSLIASGGWSQKIPGYASGIVSGHTSAYAKEEAVIRAMYVCPQMARRGLGRKMMNLIESEAMKAGVSRMLLSATKMGARLYRACGYITTGPTVISLSGGRQIQGEDMEKQLTNQCDTAA